MTNSLAEIGMSLLGTAGVMVFVLPYIMGWEMTRDQLLLPMLRWMRGNVAAVKADAVALGDAVAQLDRDFAAMRSNLEEVLE